MPNITTCDTNCATTAINTNIPGDSGQSAYTTTTEDFNVPAIAATVVVAVGNSDWMAVGETLFISDGTDYGHFTVQSINSAISITVVFDGYLGDATAGAVVGSGAAVVASGTKPAAFNTTELAALNVTLLTGIAGFTNNTGGADTDTLSAGVGIFELSIPHTFIGGTAAVESVTDLTLGFKFKILAWHFVTEVLLVGASGSRVANLDINATNVGAPASTLTIPIANAAVGIVTAATAVSGNNTGSNSDTLSLLIASGGTAFTAGSGTFVIRVQNMDTADAFASLAVKINDIRTALIT